MLCMYIMLFVDEDKHVFGIKLEIVMVFSFLSFSCLFDACRLVQLH